MNTILLSSIIWQIGVYSVVGLKRCWGRIPTHSLNLCQLIHKHQVFLDLCDLCMEVYPSPSLSFSSVLCTCLSANAVKCDIVWDDKHPNRLFISETPLRLTHQRLFTLVNVLCTSENMMSSYYHSCIKTLCWNLPTTSLMALKQGC